MTATQTHLSVVIGRTVGFRLPEGADADLLAARLAQFAGVDVLEPLAGTASIESQSGESTVSGTALRWLGLCLLFARELMQAGRMPVFDTPRIVSIQPTTSQQRFSAEIEFTRIENIHPRSYDVTLKAALDCCAQLGQAATSVTRIGELLDHLDTTLVHRLRGSIPGGKSTVPVLRVAHQLGIPFLHLGGGVYQLGWGVRGRRIDRSAVMLDSAIGARLSQNKVFAAELMRMAGLPAPDHIVAHTPAQARDAAASLGWPLVVKPVDRDRGEGVVVDIASDADLAGAFAKAAALSPGREVIVERQASGVCHRLFMSGGKLLYAVKRLPMGVIGDGVQSVEALVQHELDRQALIPPWSRSPLRPIDDEACAAMAAAGFSPQSVAARGALVPLRRIESTEAGGVDEDVGARVHSDNLRIASKAAALFGLHTAGIDIITTDIAQPWHESGAIINEVNYAPLFGGGEISMRHVPQFLQRFVEGDGRIPVEVFVGGERAVDAAGQRWQAQVAAGLRCFISSADQTIGPAGRVWPMARQSLYARAQALAVDSGVEAMVLIVQDDEFVQTGLPLAFHEPVQVIDEQLKPHGGTTPLPRKRIERLLRILGVPAGKA